MRGEVRERVGEVPGPDRIGINHPLFSHGKTLLDWDSEHERLLPVEICRVGPIATEISTESGAMRTFGIERSQGPPGDAAGSHGSPSRDIFWPSPKSFGKAARIPIVALSRDINPYQQL